MNRAGYDRLVVQILETALGAQVKKLSRHRSDYESSFRLEELDVELVDGTVLLLVLKDVSPGAILPAARQSKQQVFFSPTRELAVYDKVLSHEEDGTARCIARHIDPDSGRYWLLLERVAGMKLSFVGEIDSWRAAARWLGRFHHRQRHRLSSLPEVVPAIVYDAEYYRRWCDRACEYVSGESAGALRRVQEQYPKVIEHLAGLPRSLVHGDCYPSNILVREAEVSERICPVDWELTAIGPGLVDLASLTAGDWSEPDKAGFIQAYWEEGDWRKHWRSPEQLSADLDWCRLHLAMQWLGWTPHWQPPVDQAQDWLKELLNTADRLQLL